MYPVDTYTVETITYQKSQPPKTDPQGGRCIALKEQGANNQQLFSTRVRRK